MQIIGLRVYFFSPIQCLNIDEYPELRYNIIIEKGGERYGRTDNNNKPCNGINQLGNGDNAIQGL